MKPERIPDGPIHEFFGLTYATHLVLPRSVLQSMPLKWQAKLVALLNELDNTIDWRREGVEVARRGADGRYIPDEFRDYNRGRRRIPWRV